VAVGFGESSALQALENRMPTHKASVVISIALILLFMAVAVYPVIKTADRLPKTKVSPPPKWVAEAWARRDTRLLIIFSPTIVLLALFGGIELFV
jgi:choline-glycine betaine transporter